MRKRLSRCVGGAGEGGREGTRELIPCTQALMKYSPDEAKVIRDGRALKVHASEVVPGDIITVAVGDKIPADARVFAITSASFTIDQALLTGESQSVSKTTETVKDGGAVKQDMINMLFSVRWPSFLPERAPPLTPEGSQGTTVVSGTAKSIVTSTGSQTAIGDIHKSITSQISEKTPLKQKVDDFGNLLAKVITVICILVWVVNVGNFSDPSHGGLAKGAIYYFKVRAKRGGAGRDGADLVCSSRSLSRWPLLLSPKDSPSSSPLASR